MTNAELVKAIAAHEKITLNAAVALLRKRDADLRSEALRSKARRDRIAMAALQGLLMHSAGENGKPADFAQGAVAHADALIAELDR